VEADKGTEATDASGAGLCSTISPLKAHGFGGETDLVARDAHCNFLEG
jgi:hypothetical protein